MLVDAVRSDPGEDGVRAAGEGPLTEPVTEFTANTDGEVEDVTIHVRIAGLQLRLRLQGHWSMNLGLHLVNAVEASLSALEGREAQFVDVDYETAPEDALEAPPGDPNGPPVAGQPRGQRPGSWATYQGAQA